MPDVGETEAEKDKRLAIAMGVRLRLAREAAGYVKSKTGRANGGVRWLAKDSGVSVAFISRIEHGGRSVDTVDRGKLQLVADQLGVTVEHLLTGKETQATARDLRGFLAHNLKDEKLLGEILANPYEFTLREIDTADEQSHHEEFRHLTPRRRLEAARAILREGPSEGGVSQLNKMITDPAPSQTKGLSAKRPKK